MAYRNLCQMGDEQGHGSHNGKKRCTRENRVSCLRLVAQHADAAVLVENNKPIPCFLLVQRFCRCGAMTLLISHLAKVSVGQYFWVILGLNVVLMVLEMG